MCKNSRSYFLTKFNTSFNLSCVIFELFDRLIFKSKLMNFKKIALIGLCTVAFGCKGHTQKDSSEKKTTETFKVTKTPAEWKAQLTDMQYYVMRQQGTEPPFSSPLDKNFKKGTYYCVADGTPLFKSENKFDSGTGWPSFDRPVKGNVGIAKDNKLGYSRNEVHCAVCGGHLGHVFNDGPVQTTGKRYCIDGVALKFVPAKDEQ